MSKLKIGLLLDGMFTDKYVADLVTWAKHQHDVEVSVVLVCGAGVAASVQQRSLPAFARAVHALAKALCFQVVMGAEKLLLLLSKKVHRDHLAVVELASAAAGTPILYLALARAGTGDHFPDSELRRVRALKLDLLLQFGSAAPGGDLVGAARLGTIALDYHGKRANRAVPPGFWECYYKGPKTPFDVVHIGPGGKPRQTLVSGSFPTKYLFLLNQANLYRMANAQLKSLLKKIAASGGLPEQEVSRPYSGPCLMPPRCHQCIAYLLKVAARLAGKAFYKTFNIQQKWGLSFIHSDWKDAVLWRSMRISAPRGHFWADPFLCTHDGKTYCFVEDYVYKTNRGHIAVLEVTEQGAVRLGDSIRENFHLSFPFLFTYGGERFMCPESSEARQVRIYRCKSFPLEWELCSIAMDGVSAADSMFFEHQGKWWMLTNIDRAGLDDHCSELCLFHATSPFDNDWIPHPQNPLRIDAEGGRNAGLILEDKRIFRAAQRQGFDQYGKGLLVYEITELTESVYAERLVSEIDCNFRRGQLGSHHVSTTGKITVFDHVGRCFFP